VTNEGIIVGESELEGQWPVLYLHKRGARHRYRFLNDDDLSNTIRQNTSKGAGMAGLRTG